MKISFIARSHFVLAGGCGVMPQSLSGDDVSLRDARFSSLRLVLGGGRRLWLPGQCADLAVVCGNEGRRR
jgi:hypothetical protein